MKVAIRSGSAYRNKHGFSQTVLLCAILFILLTVPGSAYAVRGEVLLTGGTDATFRQQVAGNLSTMVTRLGREDFDQVNSLCTERGWSELNQLSAELQLRNGQPVQEARLLNLPDGGYEVRSLRVKVDRRVMQGAEGSSYQQMVITLTPDGLIDGARFSAKEDHVNRILEDAERLNDFAFRQQILQFVEIYRTAYNRKDLDYIEKVFSDDALIIVGRVVREKPDGVKQSDRLRSSSLNRDNVTFVVQSKERYLRALRGVFARNEYVQVGFDSLKIHRHTKDPFLYGVTLKQEWHSSTYSDTGYVFLMIDFNDEENPQIHVRSWQPEQFPDGSTLSVYDFNLIRGVGE